VLLDELIARQRAAGLSDHQFAALLGIPRSTWQLTRTGRKRIGRVVVAGALRAFADIETAVVADLKTGGFTAGV
jgi:hypothetical protein